MNAPELVAKVLNGYLVLVGQVLSADIREQGNVDINSGLKNTLCLITYFVGLRRPGNYTVAKIKRWIPHPGGELASVPLGAEQDKCYAFEVTKTEMKNGFLEAGMGKAEPVLLIPDGKPLAGDAPQGAATGSGLNLVKLQTTPRTP